MLLYYAFPYINLYIYSYNITYSFSNISTTYNKTYKCVGFTCTKNISLAL